MCIWLNLDGIWMLDMLVACNWMLCNVRLNDWVMKNPICGHNEVFVLIMSVNEFMVAF